MHAVCATMDARSRAGARERSPGRRWLLAALLNILLLLPVLAQGPPVLIDDPDRLFGDGAAVRAAAERLANEGAEVVVVAVQDAGAIPADAERYLDTRLDELGVADSSRELRGNQVVFYLAPEPGFDGIYFVSRFREVLEPRYRDIQNQQMRPQFTKDDFSVGMVAGIDAVRTAINPPTSNVVWLGAGVVAIAGAGAIAGPAIRKRRVTAEALTAARKRMEQARRVAGVAIADLGQRVTAAREKAQYDAISYSSMDAERIGELQRQGEELFTQAQATFDAAEEAQIAKAKPTAADYDALAAQFDEARRLAETAAAPIAEAERMRAALDAALPPNTGETRRL